MRWPGKRVAKSDRSGDEEVLWDSKVEEARALDELDALSGGTLDPQDAERLAADLAPALDEQLTGPVGSFDPRIYSVHAAAVTRAGQIRGKHYTEWPDHIRQLKRDGQIDEALSLLLGCVEAAERGRSGREPAPWYTTQAAIIYRQQKNYAAEVAVIERWEAACPPAKRGPGASQTKLGERLGKARQLLERQAAAEHSDDNEGR